MDEQSVMAQKLTDSAIEAGIDVCIARGDTRTREDIRRFAYYGGYLPGEWPGDLTHAAKEP